jgi:hypothetical protein
MKNKLSLFFILKMFIELFFIICIYIFYFNKKYIYNKIFKSPNEDELICPVCFENFNFTYTKIIPCNHMIHRDCIYECLRNNISNCPLCRKQMNGLNIELK